MMQDMMKQDSGELNNFFAAEFQLQLQHYGNKLLEGVTVCINCMRIYQFLNELYTKMEEIIEKELDKAQDDNRLKNSIFMGLDPKLNEKVIAILKRHLSRINKFGKAPSHAANSVKNTPRSSLRQNSINGLQSESRFSSIDILNGFQMMTGIDPKTILGD